MKAVAAAPHPPMAGITILTAEEHGLELIPYAARRAVACWVGDHPVLDNLQLVVSELVTNAFTHGVSGSEAECRVRLRLETERRNFKLSVVDPAERGGTPRLLEMGDVDAEHGYGLALVDAITGGMWGSHANKYGERVVWACVPMDGKPVKIQSVVIPK
jgi:hypothetical protein